MKQSIGYFLQEEKLFCFFFCLYVILDKAQLWDYAWLRKDIIEAMMADCETESDSKWLPEAFVLMGMWPQWQKTKEELLLSIDCWTGN